MRRISLCVLGLLPIVFQAQSQTAPHAPGAAPALANRPAAPEYRLHLSDKIEIQMPFSPQYDESTIVQPDGRISLHETDPVRVLGLTIPEAEAAIANAYAGILKEPKVSVLLKDFLKPSYYASGELGKPGRYEILSDSTTLMQAIAEAGGLLNERASKKTIVVFRPQGNGTYESKIINFKETLAAKAPEDYAILPGDVIYVPQNRSSKIQRYLPTSSIGTYVGPGAF